MTEQEKCPCRCHEMEGFFHCWTGPCCGQTNVLGEIYRNKRSPSTLEPMKDLPKSITLPIIKGREKWPNLISKELVDIQPMFDEKDNK